MTKCFYCNQPAVRYTNNDICIWHYHLEKPSMDWQFKKELPKLKKCIICGDMAKVEKHHVNYFPQQIQQVCYHCHQLIHKSKPYPESKTFYKGVIE